MARKNKLLKEVVIGARRVLIHFRKVKNDNGHQVENFYYDFRLNAKRYRGCCETSNLRLAEVLAVAKVRDAANEPAPVIGPGLTLSDAVAKYLDSRWSEESRTGNRTYQDFKSRLNAFAESTGKGNQLVGTSAEKFQTDIESYVEKRRLAKASGRTQTNDRLVINRFCKWLRKQDGIQWAFNPAEAVEVDGAAVAEPTAINDSEIPKLLDAAKDKDVWPVVLLCLGCGTRPREATRVTWADVNFEQGFVTVLNKKGKKQRPRQAVMPAEIQAELSAWKEKKAPQNEQERLFPFNEFTVHDMLRVLRIAAKLPDSVTFQAMRRTAATKLIDSGMPLSEYCLQMGHSLAVAEQHYRERGRLTVNRGKMNALNLSALKRGPNDLVKSVVKSDAQENTQSQSQ